VLYECDVFLNLLSNWFFKGKLYRNTPFTVDELHVMHTHTRTGPDLGRPDLRAALTHRTGEQPFLGDLFTLMLINVNMFKEKKQRILVCLKHFQHLSFFSHLQSTVCC